MIREEKYYTFNGVEIADIFDMVSEKDAPVEEFMAFLWDYYQVKELGITPVEDGVHMSRER